MKRGLVIMLAVLLVPLMAGAYDQAAVNRLLAGDKNLSGADLSNLVSGTVPPGSICYQVDFTGADFSGSFIQSFTFDSCKMANARFDGANMIGARFKFCNLEGASFAGARMGATVITQSNLKNAGLTGVTVAQYEAQFGDCDCQNLGMSGTDWGGKAGFRNCEMRGVDFRAGNVSGISLEGSRIPAGQKAYLATQNIRMFDTIQWLQPDKNDLIKAGVNKPKNIRPLKRPVAPK